MNLRVEIIGNRSIQEDLFEAMGKNKVESRYTMITEALGDGHSGPRQGDSVWPEENFILTIYCDKKMAQQIRRIVDDVKEHFPGEGLKMFATRTEEV